MNDETSTRRRAPVPLLVSPSGLRTPSIREPGGGRPQVTAACTGCGAAVWDEPLGMTVTFTDMEQTLQELPGLGWAVSAPCGGTVQVLCPACAARTAP